MTSIEVSVAGPQARDTLLYHTTQVFRQSDYVPPPTGSVPGFACVNVTRSDSQFIIHILLVLSFCMCYYAAIHIMNLCHAPRLGDLEADIGLRDRPSVSRGMRQGVSPGLQQEMPYEDRTPVRSTRLCRADVHMQFGRSLRNHN